MSTRSLLQRVSATTLMLSLQAVCLAQAVGWRGDTTGNYPDAVGPVHFSDGGPKLAWKLELPGKSSSTPVPVADRLIVPSDPHWLLAVRARDGEVLWREDMSLGKVFSEKELADRLAEFARQVARRGELVSQLSHLTDRLAKEPTDTDALRRQIAQLKHTIACLPDKVPDPTRNHKTHKHVGASCPTPVSDGKRVVAVFDSGLVACRDIDGKTFWNQWLSPPSKGYGQSMSPALAGSRVGVHVDDVLYALDLSDGSVTWSAPLTQHQGSPVAIRVDKRWVFLTTEGKVFDAEDGKVLASLGFPAMMKFNTPVVAGQRAYWVSEGKFLVTVTFSADDAGGIRVRKRHIHIPKGVYYASVLVTGESAWLWDNANYSLKDKTLHHVDLAKGKVLWSKTFGKDLPGWAYPSPTAAGPLVYVAGDGGTLAVLRPGTKRREVGPGKFADVPTVELLNRVTLEPFRSCPVFAGRRMYIRGDKYLWAFQATEEDVKAANPPASKPEAPKLDLEL